MITERFRAAIATLHIMLINDRFYEAKQIVTYEIDHMSDPPPPGIKGGWSAVAKVLRRICKERSI